jgi:release factor glutamine methyltransferase
MFVSSNSVIEIKRYFKKQLSSLFSDSEIKQISNHAIKTRLNLSQADMILADEIRLSESDLLYFRSIVKRLQTNEPVQYIFGDTDFYGLTIKCDSRALIPRPETEELVDWILADIKQFNPIENLLILDMCTGSGCIALALKSQLKNATVSAMDWSQEALDLTKENCQALKMELNIQKLDALSDFNSWDLKAVSFDVWVSNPPYIPFLEKHLMESNVLDFEPEMALFVEDDSALVFYNNIAKAARLFLKSGGVLYFELNENYAEETKQLMEEIGFISVEIKVDLQGKKRMLKAIKK